MNSIGRAAAATLLAAIAFAAPAAQQPTFRSGSKTVAIYATVSDKGGRLVPDLAAGDFEVRDDGKPQPLSVFSNEVQPITVVVLLDRSGSMRGNTGLVARGAAAFIDALGPADRARVGVFAERIEVRPETFTSDHAALMELLDVDRPPVGPTPLWNAVDEAIGALRDQDGRRVVLVFSDGGNSPGGYSPSNRSVMDVMRRAQRENVMVYTIGLATTIVNRGGGFGSLMGGMTSVRPDPSLAAVADDTGGGYFELSRAENLDATFAQVADELHHQYALGFEPTTLNDKMHKLDVRIKRAGLKARARKEYLASSH
jgi:Ca-activated chloride channel homolog